METNLVVSATSDNDVRVEARFSTLNKRGFVRGGEPVNLWYIAVTEAYNISRVPFDEVLRDYLVFMLLRFMNKVDLMDQLASFDLYKHTFGLSRYDAVSSDQVADMCLQYVAFFPERSYNRHQPRSLEYVTQVGASLYLELARYAKDKKKDDWWSNAFQVMSTSFVRAVMVLRALYPDYALKREIREEVKRKREKMRHPSIADQRKHLYELDILGGRLFWENI